MADRNNTRIVAAGVAVVFGLLTVVSGGRALFGGVDMGAVVPWVLWFNFLAGFAYVLAGFGLWRGVAWAKPLSIGIFAATAAVGLDFAAYALRGGVYELRTAGAMALRVAAWGWIAWVAARV